MRALFARAHDLGLAVLAYLACADASIISGKSHGKYSFTKEQRIPDAGVDAVRPICDPLVSECFSSDEQVQDELIIALEADGLTTVTGSVDLGELICDGLDDAPGSDLLRFTISANETVVAQRTSYSVASGNAFSNNEDRKVWMGEVVDPAPAADSAPTTISMTWADPCDVETFLLKVVKQNADSTARVLTSVPCGAGSSSDICLVDLKVEFQDDDTSLAEAVNADEDGNGIVEGAGKVEGEGRSLLTGKSASIKDSEQWSSDQGLGRLTGHAGVLPSGRRLQDSTQIDLLVFYTPEAMAQVAASTAAQMESIIAAAFASTNEAMANSEISLDINVVHVEPLPYTAAVGTASVTLQTLRDNDQVKALRSVHRADLVTLLAQLSDGCGLGYLYPYSERSGYSVSRPNCFYQYTHSHELGHNLGCSHNRDEYDDEEDQHDYAHGFRYCTGDDPYRTIMSYGCPRASAFSATVYKGNHYSNPDVYYQGKPTGTDTENCARAINENKLTVSNFRVDSCMGPDGPCESTPDCCTGTCVDGTCGLEECTGTLTGYEANGYCSTALNNLECGYDGGDCCECDCIAERANECGVAGYTCLNPASSCFVSDDDGAPVVVDGIGSTPTTLGTTSSRRPLGVCGTEFAACSTDEECAACLRIDESTTCRRDTLVDVLHGAEISEVICCVFESDARCMDNALLQASIECLDGVSPLELVCMDLA